MRHILFFGRRPFPNDHPVLEEVYTRRLKAYGYETVWVLQPAGPEWSGARAEWNGQPVYVTRQRRRRGVVRPVELVSEYFRLGSLALREHEVHVVQGRTGPFEAFAAWRLARRHRMPFVLQYSFPLTLSRDWTLRRMALGWLLRPLARAEVALTRFYMRQAALTLGISEALCAHWRAQGVVNIVPFPMGIDPSLDPGRVVPAPLPPHSVVYFGSMDPQRSLCFLLDVFARVRELRPATRLVMVGERTDPRLEPHARALGLDDAITWTGLVPRAEVPRYIRAARCTVSPIPPEPMYVVSSPTKVVESLGMEVPVVANREILDQRELVEASGGGLTPAYLPEEFAADVVRLLDDPEGAARRGRQGRRWVAEHRSYDALAQQLGSHYDRLWAPP